MDTDLEVLSARLSAIEVLLFSLAKAIPSQELAPTYVQQKALALSALNNSQIPDNTIAYLEHTLTRYEKALGLPSGEF